MLSRYKKIFLLMLQAAGLPLALHAQNTPQLSQTSVSGSSAPATLPPSLSSTALPNYIRVYSPKVPMTAEPNMNTATPEQVQVATDYKDGFNRTIMSVAHNATTSGATLMNVIQPVDTRFRQEQLGFPAYSSTSADYTPNVFMLQNDYYYQKYPNEYFSAASKAQLISTASARGSKTLLPGKSQIGQDRGVTSIKIMNADNEVRIWGIDASGLPLSSGFYAAGQLFGEQTTDNSGAESIVYTDKDGKVILKKIVQNTTVSGQTVTKNYATTLYVYDDYNRLRYTFPPLAYTAAIGGTISATTLNQLCFQYKYDSKGRLSAQSKPAEDNFTNYVYDKKDRVVMSQTPNEAAAGQWEVKFYDIQGRLKATSLYTNSNNQAYWQNLMDNGTPGSTAADLSWYLMTDAGLNQYPAENAVSGNTMMSYTYFDDYSKADVSDNKWNACVQLMFTNDWQGIAGVEEPVRSQKTMGMVTGGKVRILPAPGVPTTQTGQWTESAVFYDDKGRTIYSAAWDMDGSNFVHEHYNATAYNFMGQALISKHKMSNKAAGANESHTELSRNYYNPQTGQLTKTTHKNDGQAWAISSMYTYDDLGRVQRKVLGNYGEVQDMSYNIRGQLAGINETYALTGNKQGQSRSYGEALRYDYGFSQPRYDGKVAGMIWRGSSAANMYAYGYSYDNEGRLLNADFRAQVNGSAWGNQSMDYSLIQTMYDANGNITSMNQMGPGNGTPAFIDKLLYTYSGNRLTGVMDGIPANYGNGDFQNPNGTNTDYAYDANGNLTLDNNKGITAITYNYFNKPQVITMTGGKSIAYSYNAAGAKVQEKVTDPGTANKITDYVGNYIYEDNQLSYALTGDGRSVMDKTTMTFRDEYFVKDHLGNVRSVVDVQSYPIAKYLASYELASANLENMLFDDIDKVRDDKPGATFNGDLKSARLNGEEPERRTGTSLLLKVMAGDKVEMNVNNFYENYDADKDQPVSVEEMMSSVISTLTGGAGGTVEGEFHGRISPDKYFTEPNMNVFNDMVNAGTDPSKPKAYLNYILFDENMRIVETSSGAFQANGQGTWAQIGTTAPMEIPQNGYLAVYLNNRTQIGCGPCSDVFFDQLVVKFSKGSLKEESHYYPFGLPIKNMGSAANGFTPNRRKYQGNEYITEAGLNWMDFNNRSYDPQIGRFLQVDPLASETDMMSPYVAMNNEPVLTVDPLGLQGVSSMDFKSDNGSQLDQMEFLRRFSPGTLQAMSIKPMSFDEGYMEAVQAEFLKENEERLNETTGEGNFSGVGFVNFSGTAQYPIEYQETTIYSTDGSLNVVQAAALDIGRNDANRAKVEQTVTGIKVMLGAGAAPFVLIAAAEAAPVALTTFLSNPAGWTSAGGSAIMGAAGYESELPSAGATKMLPKGYNRFPRAATKFAEHGGDWTTAGINAYYKRAISLADSKVGGNILGFTGKDGWVFRMNSKTSEFVTSRPNGEIATFFRRLSEPTKYWAEQVKKYGE